MSPSRAALLAAGFLSGASAPCALGQHFRVALEAPSTFTIHHCTDPCDCLPFDESGPVQGACNLVLIDSNPLVNTYAVSAIYFHAVVNDRDVLITGAGIYEIGGEVAVRQHMRLQLLVDDQPSRTLDSGWSVPQRAFPQIDITPASDDPTICTEYEVVIHASPTCPADFNGDTFVDPLDYNLFINAFEAGSPSADYNGDGFLDPLDYNLFINEFESGC